MALSSPGLALAPQLCHFRLQLGYFLVQSSYISDAYSNDKDQQGATGLDYGTGSKNLHLAQLHGGMWNASCMKKHK